MRFLVLNFMQKILAMSGSSLKIFSSPNLRYWNLLGVLILETTLTGIAIKIFNIWRLNFKSEWFFRQRHHSFHVKYRNCKGFVVYPRGVSAKNNAASWPTSSKVDVYPLKSAGLWAIISWKFIFILYSKAFSRYMESNPNSYLILDKRYGNPYRPLIRLQVSRIESGCYQYLMNHSRCIVYACMKSPTDVFPRVLTIFSDNPLYDAKLS